MICASRILIGSKCSSQASGEQRAEWYSPEYRNRMFALTRPGETDIAYTWILARKAFSRP